MNKFFKRMTAVFLAVSTTAASILMPATGIYAAETAATTQNTQAAQTTQNSQNTQTTKNTQEYDWPQAPRIPVQFFMKRMPMPKDIQPAQLKFLPDFSQLKTVALTRRLHSQVRQPIL